MSINSAMLAGVTGLTANAAALSATSDNIANVNTVGYKRNQTIFSDLVTAGSDQHYTAGGVQALSTQYITEQGLMQSTTSPTDLAISGQGFFVTTQTPATAGPTATRLFTRAGSFTVDNMGYLKNSAGLYLQGWLADPTTGAITTDPSDITKLQAINVANVGGAAGATTIAGVNANLDAGQTVSQASIDHGTTATDAYAPNSATTSMAAYDPTTNVGTKPDFSVTVPLADSQGGARSMQIDFLKSNAAPNQWYAEAHIVPATAIHDGTGLIDGQVATGIVSFTPDGKLDTANTTLFGAGGAQTPDHRPLIRNAGRRRGQLGGQPGDQWPDDRGQPGRRHRRPVAAQRPLDRPVGDHQRHRLRQPELGVRRRQRLCHRQLRQRRDPRHRPGGHRHLPQPGRPDLDERGRLWRVPGQRRLQPEGGGHRRRGHCRSVLAGILDRRPVVGVQQPDHDPAGLLGVFQDHHHRRSDAPGPD